MPDFVCWIPDSGDREWLTYSDRGYVAYENRKIVVGTVVASDDRVLLCRRAIVPRLGFWMLSTGYPECGETTERHEARGGREGTQPHIQGDGVSAIYSINREAEAYPASRSLRHRQRIG